MINSNGQAVISVSGASTKIYNAIETQKISYTVHILEEGERLDYLAGIFYGDSALWWVLAAASGIGYALQVTPGTIIRVPSSISEVFGVLM
jgi:nucleoid-associated protein YgaU